MMRVQQQKKETSKHRDWSQVLWFTGLASLAISVSLFFIPISTPANFVFLACGLSLLIVGISLKTKDTPASNKQPATHLADVSDDVLKLAERAARFGVVQMSAFTQRAVASNAFRELYQIENNRDLVFIDDWLSLVHEQDRHSAAVDLDHCFRKKPRYQSEFRVVLKDGKIRHILARGYVDKFQDPEQAILIGIHLDITRQKEIEHAITYRLEEEQMRISRELHDRIGQQLTGLSLLTKSLHLSLQNEGSDHATLAGELTQSIPPIVKDFRSIIKDLMPPELDSSSLRDALERLAEDTESLGVTTCQCQFEVSQPLDDDAMARQLFRIAQEAVHNAIKHAKATTITLTLKSNSNGIELIVTDDGVGISTTDQELPGMGMQIFEHRTKSMGATLQINSNLGAGTTIRVCWQKRFDDDVSSWSRLSDPHH